MAEPSPAAAAGAMCRLSLRCDLVAVRETASAARQFLETHRVVETELAAIELALVEACNNAVLYAKEPASEDCLEIQVFCDDAVIELQVIDHSEGFNWPAEIELPAPDAEHGRGLFIIQSVMDKTTYLRAAGENRLVLRKNRQRSAIPKVALNQQPPKLCDDAIAAENSNDNSVEPIPPSSGEKLEVVQQKLALSEQVIGAMAKEICVRSEELAAIFRSTTELGKTNRLENFSQRLLDDLLHITGTDWFVLRLIGQEDSVLRVTNASVSELDLAPIDLSSKRQSAELAAARQRKPEMFNGKRPLRPTDPLARAATECAGIVCPIVVDEALLGTLAIGRKGESALSDEQVQVMRTFTDFLAIHVVNARLQQDQVNTRLTAQELEIARNIQQSLLPIKFPRIHGFGLSGFCLSARQVGGDFYDVLPLADDRLLLVVADVMGKGVPAAMFAATLHTLVRIMTEWTDQPAELLSRMNKFMYQELSGVDMFITVQLALVDAANDRLTVASAGHCPLLLISTDGKLETLSPEGMPLGILPEAVFEEATVRLSDCACALLYTDGLTDARNAHGEFYGQERLLTWLKENSPQRQTAVQLSYAFLRDLKAFEAQVSSYDDQTFLILAKEEVSTQFQPDCPREDNDTRSPLSDQDQAVCT
jgi:serine phosphatase RsbU (regulator of sigma subunit)/anti-sigma regulatory factor (Ser/Thr protein kinase)